MGKDPDAGTEKRTGTCTFTCIYYVFVQVLYIYCTCLITRSSACTRTHEESSEPTCTSACKKAKEQSGIKE